MDLKVVLCLLEDRLTQHDSNRKELQCQLDSICSNEESLVDALEERLIREIRDKFDKTEERILSIINKLNSTNESDDDLDALMIQAQEELVTEQKYEIKYNKSAKSFATSCKLVIKEKRRENCNTNNECDNVYDRIAIRISNLHKQLDETHESMIAVQDKVMEICTKRRDEVDELRKRVNAKLEQFFTQEDARLQGAVNIIRRNIENEGSDEAKTLVAKAKLVLVLKQCYTLSRPKNDCSLDGYDIIVTKEAPLEYLGFNERKALIVTTSMTDDGRIMLSFAFFNSEEITTLKPLNLVVNVVVRVWEDSCEHAVKALKSKYKIGHASPTCFVDMVAPGTTYCLEIMLEDHGLSSEWSDCTVFTTPDFKECAWRNCSSKAADKNKYIVDSKNPRIAVKVNDCYCTVVGNLLLPPRKVVSWDVKVLKSRNNDCYGIYIGAASFDIDQNNDNLNKCGWYFNCQGSSLRSGPPHNYCRKKYGPLWLFKRTIRTGGSIGVTMDTTLGVLSFSVNSKSYGVAYEGIPLDKPLIPCVILHREGDSVEFIASDIKESYINGNGSIPIPSNVTATSPTWDSIALTWDKVSDASFYQIEVDGSKFWDATTKNVFAKRELLPDTEHSFRVRSVKGSLVSEWSDIVEGKTLKESFETSGWKECPDDVDTGRKYIVDVKNPKIATKVSDDGFGKNYCTIIGNTRIPSNKVTSWSIKVLKSDNDGCGIYVGVAPFDIDQNTGGNDYNCGWYFYFHSSTLFFGPPHNFTWTEYGPISWWNGQHAHTGDSVGVVMDTTKGELSFILNGVNLGVAYEWIPLDKPLVPCAILDHKDDSVELDMPEAKETVDSSISIPSNITAKSSTWDSITLTWDEVSDASSYQIEVDGSKLLGSSTTNAFTKSGLLPETEHNFRVRTVRGSLVGGWSDVVKGRTLKVPEFSGCVWKKCSDDVYEDMKYSVDEINPRIASKINLYDCCTIIGNTAIPFNTVTSWNVKILKSGNYCYGIYIGVAPFDINQNVINRYRCGWYFNCGSSSLFSGPPHNCSDKEYGPRKRRGEYVHTKNSAGVVMDTAEGELSFVLNGANHGAAYKGIPLDKPLVPCVILEHKDDSVELVI